MWMNRDSMCVWEIDIAEHRCDRASERVGASLVRASPGGPSCRVPTHPDAGEVVCVRLPPFGHSVCEHVRRACFCVGAGTNPLCYMLYILLRVNTPVTNSQEQS